MRFPKVICLFVATVLAGCALAAVGAKQSDVRWVDVDGMKNVRDIGGWTGLRTGRAFRGSEPDCRDAAYMASQKQDYHNLNVTAAGLRVLREELGIRTDLDLRGESECPHPETSALGVRLVRAPIGAYTSAFTDTNLYAKALRVFAKDGNYPIYFHCWGGADRTGTIALLLEGLCGAPEETLLADYELTSLAKVFGERTRTDARMVSLMARLKGYPGDSLADRIAAFMHTTLGLTREEIAAIRRNLSPETPADARLPELR